MNPNLRHLYISPLEACNLRCQICYTTKSPGKLSNQQILGFIHRYRQTIPLETVTFCGGEVFLLTDFPDLINNCTQQGIFTQIITNGTIDRLHLIKQPNSINLIVSLDGLPTYHDKNRGVGNWQHSFNFLKHAHALGFHLEIFSIVTQQNLDQIPDFEQLLTTELGTSLPVTYHPRKPASYLQSHPTSNHCGAVDGFSFLTPQQHCQLGQQKSIFPPPHLNCYQISLMSDGQIYGCCEGVRPLGSISTNIDDLIAEFDHRIDHSLECIEPNFVCGLKELYVS